MSRAHFILISAAVLVVAAGVTWLSRQVDPGASESIAVRPQVRTQSPQATPSAPTWPRRARTLLPPPRGDEGPATRAAVVGVAERVPSSHDLPPLPQHEPADAPAPEAPKERPLAREALALVGADPVAEAVWYDAINDPQRSAHERSDLIEDLNEDGFADPHHVTADDLPLIESRLLLIEQLAPEAMDEVNFEAFAEAYKDLVNMYARALGM